MEINIIKNFLYNNSLGIISLLGTLIVFIRYDKKINSQNIKINDFILAENKRSKEDELKASFEIISQYHGKGSGDVIIKNIGKSEARNLNIRIEERDKSGIYWHLGNIFPYSHLSPGSIIKIHYGLDSGFQKDPICIFSWEDDFDKNRISKHSIFLG